MNTNPQVKPHLLIIEDDDLQYEIYEDALGHCRLTRVKTGSAEPLGAFMQYVMTVDPPLHATRKIQQSGTQPRVLSNSHQRPHPGGHSIDRAAKRARVETAKVTP